MSVSTKALSDEAARLDKQYGYRTGALGSEEIKLNVIPTGILSLDFALGTGGWPRGNLIEVFGPPDIGKSSVIGLSAIRMAQEEGLLCGIVGLEPGFDPLWAKRLGVDPENLIVARPDTGEDAFNILYDWVTGPLFDLIVFDSIGAVLRGTEIEKDDKSKAAKPAQAGQAALITWGVKRILQPAFKGNKTVIFLNQIRDVMNASYPGMLDSPGGHGLRHSCSVRVQLKPGPDRYLDQDKVITGRSLIAEIARNKVSEGTRQRAVFDFYQKETEDHPVGVDTSSDVVNTCMKLGIIQKSGGWYSHDSFPGEKHQLQGKAAVGEFLAENPEVLADFRREVISKMVGQAE